MTKKPKPVRVVVEEYSPKVSNRAGTLPSTLIVRIGGIIFKIPETDFVFLRWADIEPSTLKPGDALVIRIDVERKDAD